MVDSDLLKKDYDDYMGRLHNLEYPQGADLAAFWSCMSTSAMYKGYWARAIAYNYLFEVGAVPMTSDNKWIYDWASSLVANSYSASDDRNMRVQFKETDDFGGDKWLLLTDSTDHGLQQSLVEQSVKIGESLESLEQECKERMKSYNLVVGFNVHVDNRDFDYFNRVIEMECDADESMTPHYSANQYPVGSDLIKYAAPRGFRD